MALKVLHTSDWHLGHTLYGKKRIKEFALFFDWLVEAINTQRIDVLIIAGDIFDTATPSNRSVALYYQFLTKILASSCRHIIIVGGNHDSPAFLNAPKELLEQMNIHIIGAASEDVNDEVIVLKDIDDTPEAIICAIPYLRDKDVRTVAPLESDDDKTAQLINGIVSHYEAVYDVAVQKQRDVGKVPIIATGHLFAAGGSRVEGDGIRDLYVGSLAYVNGNQFPQGFDYVALGHLHSAQLVGGKSHMRYCGSPIPLSFIEADKPKYIVTAVFEDGETSIVQKQVPTFQPLKRIQGDLTEIEKKINELKRISSGAWLEIEYTGDEIVSDLRGKILELLAESDLELCRIQNTWRQFNFLKGIEDEQQLEQLKVEDVFSKCLDSVNVNVDQRSELTKAFNEIYHLVQLADEPGVNFED